MPAMRSQPIRKAPTLDLRHGSTRSSQPWTRGTRNRATPRHLHPPTLHTHHHRRRSSTTRRLEKQHTKHLWYLQPAIMASNLCSITTVAHRRYRRHQPAQCQHLHNSTHGQQLFLVTRSQGLHSHLSMAKGIMTAGSLQDGRNTGDLSRATIHEI